MTEFKHIKFPSQGTIFDYFLDHETKRWSPWSEKLQKFTLDPEMPLQVHGIQNCSEYFGMYFLHRLS